MQHGDPDIEARFLARRDRVVQAAGVLFGGAALGLVALFVTKASTPEAFESVLPVFVCGLAALGARLWWTLRREWRCPACDVRWRFEDSLASAHWNCCADCGAPLRVVALRRDREWKAVLDEQLGVQSHAELVARFRRGRRRAGFAAVAAGAVGIGVYVWIAAQSLGDMAEQIAVATAVGLAVAIAAAGSRCPRCRTGILRFTGSHCQRCGFSLGEESDSSPPALDPRGGGAPRS